MIRFQALMHAVQQSIHSAAQAVESAGFKHIDKFFDEIPNDEPTADRESQKQSVVRRGKRRISANDSTPVTSEPTSTYQPKMVSMAFPKQAADGSIDSTIVNVPLITLCPISSPRIKDVNFSADLEVTADDNDELFVAFRATQKGNAEGSSLRDPTNTRIEISLVGHEPPEGLQKIIEGYEKALRAQIPG